MQWKIFETIRQHLIQQKISPKAKIKILYSSLGKRDVVSCTFENMMEKLWQIYDSYPITSIAIVSIDGKPFYKYCLPKAAQLEKRPGVNGHTLIKNWNSFSRKKQYALTEMLAKQIEEYNANATN